MELQLGLGMKDKHQASLHIYPNPLVLVVKLQGTTKLVRGQNRVNSLPTNVTFHFHVILNHTPIYMYVYIILYI